MRARALNGEAGRREKQGRQSCLSRLAPTVTRMVVCVSRAFCSKDQEKRETARSLLFARTRRGFLWAQNKMYSLS